MFTRSNSTYRTIKPEISGYGFCSQCGITIVDLDTNMIKGILSYWEDETICNNILSTGLCSNSCIESKYGHDTYYGHDNE